MLLGYWLAYLFFSGPFLASDALQMHGHFSKPMETNPYALTSAQKTLRAALAQETGPAGHLPFFTFSRPILGRRAVVERRRKRLGLASVQT